MARPPDERRRRDLLDRLIAAVADGGIGGRSLRELGEAAGTSHRMLLHHFGSRDELLLAIVGEVERRQAATLADLPDHPADAFATMWADLRRPELRPLERLFFECYARGAQGEEPFTRLLPAAIGGWLADVDERTAGGADRALARLGLAVTRGLLLDLVATGDEGGVDAAAARFVDLLRAADHRAEVEAPLGRERGAPPGVAEGQRGPGVEDGPGVDPPAEDDEAGDGQEAEERGEHRIPPGRDAHSDAVGHGERRGDRQPGHDLRPGGLGVAERGPTSRGAAGGRSVR